MQANIDKATLINHPPAFLFMEPHKGYKLHVRFLVVHHSQIFVHLVYMGIFSLLLYRNKFFVTPDIQGFERVLVVCQTCP